MNWQSLIAKGKEITADQARGYIESQAPGGVQIVDVRQPKEYETAHIPGAVLIPLNELVRRVGEIAADRNTIVYCRSGARSSAACQILSEFQFKNVLNLRGGMLQWQGQRAMGGETLGLEYFVSGDFASALEMAISMEAGLKQFYLLLADAATAPTDRELLRSMARLEDGHMAKLRGRYRTGTATPATAPAPRPDMLEGGFDPDEFADTFRDRLDGREAIVQLAMMFEAQALDLYSRLARRHNDLETQSFFLEMAAEEQQHLDRLAGELDRLLA